MPIVPRQPMRCWEQSRAVACGGGDRKFRSPETTPHEAATASSYLVFCILGMIFDSGPRQLLHWRVKLCLLGCREASNPSLISKCVAQMSYQNGMMQMPPKPHYTQWHGTPMVHKAPPYLLDWPPSLPVDNYL
ncbi:hypothetical protein PILCRDRAFT_320137 [Piloderma croceum F 1598]|uniref:Uncharacterized protein n=1 Tax=Piloderma croceum (strain F 1598) TaxID=765440 RepID=A0A0C3G2Z5_PILCF|nr:hypothetical protein PILCRDRAFT_320137 [Piloderma croceum F 1598]